MWIEPLALQTWIINVFAGDAQYFTAIAIIAILTLAGYFRMNGLSLGFSVILFLLMFSDFVPMSLVVLISIIGGLVLGYIIPKIVKN